MKNSAEAKEIFALAKRKRVISAMLSKPSL